jgi:hypothetical protein
MSESGKGLWVSISGSSPWVRGDYTKVLTSIVEASENRSSHFELKVCALRWTDGAQETWCLTGLRCLLKGVSELDQSGFTPGAAEE